MDPYGESWRHRYHQQPLDRRCRYPEFPSDQPKFWSANHHPYQCERTRDEHSIFGSHFRDRPPRGVKTCNFNDKTRVFGNDQPLWHHRRYYSSQLERQPDRPLFRDSLGCTTRRIPDIDIDDIYKCRPSFDIPPPRDIIPRTCQAERPKCDFQHPLPPYDVQPPELVQSCRKAADYFQNFCPPEIPTRVPKSIDCKACRCLSPPACCVPIEDAGDLNLALVLDPRANLNQRFFIQGVDSSSNCPTYKDNLFGIKGINRVKPYVWMPPSLNAHPPSLPNPPPPIDEFAKPRRFGKDQAKSSTKARPPSASKKMASKEIASKKSASKEIGIAGKKSVSMEICR